MTLPDRESFLALDREDPLAGARERFAIPDGLIYLDGNSLGPLPEGLAERLAEVVTGEWGRGLITSWNGAGWIDLPVRVGEKIAPLIGAAPGQVVAADSTSINLFKVMAAALAARPGRTVILSDPENFPTDLYMAQGLAAAGIGAEFRLCPVAEIPAALDRNVAVVALSHVDFKSGRLHDMAAITRAAHAAGALIVWDLAHSAGALPVALDDADADFAVGCSYKYLNGGPGATAFLYVNRRLQDAVVSPLTGWMGHAAPFAFDRAYRPAPGVARFLCGTPPILSLAALDHALDIWRDVDPARVREKSLALARQFMALVDGLDRAYGLEIVTPRVDAERGSHVSVRHPDGYAIVQALIEAGVIGDFREPDLMRFGFTPLYTRHVDIHDAVAALERILREGRYRAPRFAVRGAVT
ncbi:kynureninase [Oceanibacterium hippocampi]|uniref:Kynureninase n=1 Tax=Oceanibacterium hippocampi TaxID=745714 RepID=A0A1Y5S579_9PROT|nr:kynureninase [Oceanibacterium hippocampi]SLN32824.1 Kynureninase [Oceanibacterium hippocampi]